MELTYNNERFEFICGFTEKDINLREFLSNEEIEKVRQREVMVTEFIKLEYDYVQIKNLLKVK